MDLAVGVVIGAAFNGVVQAIVKDLLTPIITLNFSKFNYIDLFNNIVSFLLIATAVYFFVILPMNAFTSRVSKKEIKNSTTKRCPECLSEIPIEAKRCAHCGQPQTIKENSK